MAPSQREWLRQMLAHRSERLREETRARSRPGLKARLRRIRDAEARLRSGQYGYCEGCFLTIPWGELIAEPERRRCARCQPSADGVPA